jgi:hypothetical protein
MSLNAWIRICMAAIIALAVVFFLRLQNADGTISSLGNEIPSLTKGG